MATQTNQQAVAWTLGPATVHRTRMVSPRFPVWHCGGDDRASSSASALRIVFHESFRQGDKSVTCIDHVRGRFQDGIIHTLHRLSAYSVFTIPLGSITWLPKNDTKSAFIPLGANIPEVSLGTRPSHRLTGGLRTVVVFCLAILPIVRLN